MTTQPTFKEKPYVIDTPLLLLEMSATSKHQDDVFKVMEVATGKDIQLLMSQNAMPPAINDVEVQKGFGQKYESLKGKNVASAFKYKYAPINYAGPQDEIIRKQIDKAATDVLAGVDINTALRNAEDAANKAIAEAK
jgi:hypothetical protein